MLMSRRARSKFDELNEASASYFARHYNVELQEAYEATVYAAAEAFVTQIAEDEDEAREGSRDDVDPLAFDPRDDSSPGVW